MDKVFELYDWFLDKLTPLDNHDYHRTYNGPKTKPWTTEQYALGLFWVVVWLVLVLLVFSVLLTWLIKSTISFLIIGSLVYSCYCFVREAKRRQQK